MLEKLRKEVHAANLMLPQHGLVIFTWGNVSAIDRNANLVVIKPSGVDYADTRPENMVVVDLKGQTVEGDLKPSSDTLTHLELYRSFPNIGAVAHTHSRCATIFAQNQKPIPPYGTTHADYFHGPVPCLRPLTDREVASDYELNTGKVIARDHPDYEGIPGCLVASHGPFTWGRSALEAAHNAAVLEEIAAMALFCPNAPLVSKALLDKHYSRKHGPNASYGQKTPPK
ncbi:MAG: L-ribulose-5-phosphate 4-epimerase AraD [Deltaproteobacteria bacterium]|jgi:L-ribulose-5-phosphate 4-epimerase|nr:L-ribulose-5-phosphate 4-epimerase AraD [Deltaproteobacteria bacterium]